MDEFSLIKKYLQPLAANFPGSLNLSDDAAILTPQAGYDLVMTKDALSQGVHFIGSEDPALIAGKALRVNLSDLAAMGAAPLCYFLALMLPQNTTEEWLGKFASGLKKTQEEFAIHLAGGDTTATQGSLSISITAIGNVPAGAALKRSGAKIGDDIYVSGTLGDAALGLELLQSTPSLPLPLTGRGNVLINRYLTPEPRIKLGIALRDIANSAMDISDGLAQDLGHICTASNVGAAIYVNLLPLSAEEISQFLPLPTGESPLIPPLPTGEGGVRVFQAALTGGDDYELLFTAAPDKKKAIAELAGSLKLPLTNIGKITEGSDVKVLDGTGNEIILDKKGFSHF